MRMKLNRILSLLFCLCLAAVEWQAAAKTEVRVKQNPAVLSGTIFDRNGSVITAAQVSISNKSNAKFQAESNSEGKFRIDLPAGFYSIEIEANGFLRYRLDCYQVPSQGFITLDATLTVRGEPTCSGPWEQPCAQRQRPARKRRTIILE
jgi:hypothetical protein